MKVCACHHSPYEVVSERVPGIIVVPDHTPTFPWKSVWGEFRLVSARVLEGYGLRWESSISRWCHNGQPIMGEFDIRHLYQEVANSSVEVC